MKPIGEDWRISTRTPLSLASAPDGSCSTQSFSTFSGGVSLSLYSVPVTTGRSSAPPMNCTSTRSPTSGRLAKPLRGVTTGTWRSTSSVLRSTTSAL